MIQFNFTGHPSVEAQEKAKEYFIEHLGPFKDEFDEKGGIVTYNYEYPEKYKDQYNYVLSPEHSLPDFIFRWDAFLRQTDK